MTNSRKVLGRRWLGVVALIFLAACGRTDGSAERALPANEWLEFDGTWTAAGTRETLQLGPDRHAAIFHLMGSLLLSGARRPAVGFRADVIGFSDTRAGMEGRAVWTDERGDKLFSELKGQFVGDGNRITGTFTGGTGRYAGVTGEYTFQWQYVVDSGDGSMSGRAVDLKGRARLRTPSGAQSR